jgi:aminoglycoside phosphotransferase (APT) family kinase protein
MLEPSLGRRLGVGKEAEVFDLGEHVIKLYRTGAAKTSAFREAANLSIVEARGLPAPRVIAVQQVNQRWGIVMSKAGGASFAEALAGVPAQVAGHLDTMAALQARMHGEAGTGLADVKARLRSNIARAAVLGSARQRRLLQGLAELPDGDRLCHGDFHPWNILGPPGSAIVVDWLDAGSGPPAADVCRSYVLMSRSAPELAAAYVDTYARVAGLDRREVFAWLPFVAAARLAENVLDETSALLAMVDRAGPH